MLHMLYSLFCKQKTAYEMRISDWSSDVCSSDLRRCVPWDDRADNADRFPNQQTDAWPGVKYVPFFKGKAAREIRVKIEQTDDRRGHKAGKAAHDAHFPFPDVRNLRPASRHLSEPHHLSAAGDQPADPFEEADSPDRPQHRAVRLHQLG